jgi:uncharacterized protein (TIGR03437 family)
VLRELSNAAATTIDVIDILWNCRVQTALTSVARALIAAARGILLAIVVAMVTFSQTVPPTSPAVGDGTFVPAPGSPFSANQFLCSFATGDFNGDGLPDLVVGGDLLTILLATPEGGFVQAPGSPIPAARLTTGLAIGDFNGDGKLDIAAIGVGGLFILLGDGRGGFTIASSFNVTPSSSNIPVSAIGAADFNRDGKLDLVFINEINADYTEELTVLLGDGKGNFTPAPGGFQNTGGLEEQLTIADFNGDGNPDVAVTLLLTDQVIVLLGDGTGGLSPSPQGPLATGLTPIGIVHGDFNGDGKIDLAVANSAASSVTILLGDGTGAFTRVPDSAIGGGTPEWLAVGDIDGDGILDLAVADGYTDSAIVLLGDGNGGFRIPSKGQFFLPGKPVEILLADFNTDGRLDVATLNQAVPAGSVSVNLGAAAPSSFQLSLWPTSPAPAVGVPVMFGLGPNLLGFDAPTGAVTILDGSAAIITGQLDLGGLVFGTTFGTAGVHSLVAVYQGDLRTKGFTTAPLAINVAQGSQTISFATLPAHAYGDPPFLVSAFSSSGLPVTITVISGPAIVAGNLLTLTGAGVVTLQASQPGDANYLPAAPVQQQLQVSAPLLRIDAVLNAASYSAGPFGPGSLVVVFGDNLASLASIQIKDASGKVSNTLPYFSSSGQMNFILPPDLKPGSATLTVQVNRGPSATAPISIANIGPGLFSADASGTGVAAGSAVRVSASEEQTQLPINSCTGQPAVCTAIPIDLGIDSDTVYLTLYGTGIRGRSALAAVTATIGGISTGVLYAGAQPAFPGLDQVNLPINPMLRGRGSVDVVLNVDGVAANVVTVAIK